MIPLFFVNNLSKCHFKSVLFVSCSISEVLSFVKSLKHMFCFLLLSFKCCHLSLKTCYLISFHLILILCVMFRARNFQVSLIETLICIFCFVLFKFYSHHYNNSTIANWQLNFCFVAWADLIVLLFHQLIQSSFHCSALVFRRQFLKLLLPSQHLLVRRILE